MIEANSALIGLLNPEFDFFSDIEECLKANSGIIDCIIEWTQEKGIELEQVVPLIRNNQVLKSKLTIEAETLNFLKKKKSHFKI